MADMTFPQGSPPRARRGRRVTGLLVALFLVACLLPPATATADETRENQETEKPGLFQRFRAWRLDKIAETDAYLLLAPTTTYVNLQDTRMTPLIYGGFGFGFVLQDLVIWPNLISDTTFTGHFSAPSVPDVLPGIYQNINGTMDMAYLYRVPGVGSAIGGQLAAGGSLSAGTSFRLYDKLQNSALNFDIVASVNASARWGLSFVVFNRSLTWHLAGTTPLFSYVGRYPEYTIDGLRSYWAPPWVFPRITIETGLGTGLRWSEENRVELSYTWDFYALNELDGLHVLRIGTHQLALSLGTKRM
jgi:hypothetical protein